MRKYFISTIIIALTATMARAEMFDTSAIPEREKLKLRFVYKGVDLAKPAPIPYSVRYSAGESLIRAVYDTHWVGEGGARHIESVISGTAQNGYNIQYFFKFKPGPKLVMSLYEKTVFFPNGKKIRTESYDYDDSIPALPRDMIHPYTFHLAARGMDFRHGSQKRFYVWFSPTQIFGINLKVVGEESVVVPAGTIRCHRLDLTPDMVDFAGAVMGRVLKPLLANYTLWVDKAAPHRLVKYHGPFGLINLAGGPSEVYELTGSEE